MLTPAKAKSFSKTFAEIVANVSRHIRGKDDVVAQALVCLLAEGHLLIEDVPGVGKTTLARALAQSMDASWHRIQFTPDLLPSDITGVEVFDQRSSKPIFHPGPVFANLVLADEINRASPKTQSALLEVMEERQATVDGTSRPVPRPFMVIATQNPIDMDGTYALPEAQLDRFLMRISVGYPDLASETEILANVDLGQSIEDIGQVVSTQQVAGLIVAASNVHVEPNIREYIVRLVAYTREITDLRLGASPRSSVALLRASKVRAAAEGRHFVTPDDVKALAHPVLTHRLILAPEAELAGTAPGLFVEAALTSVSTPAAVR